MTKRKRRLIINGVFFAVMFPLVWVIGWWAILAGFFAAVVTAAVLPSAANSEARPDAHR